MSHRTPFLAEERRKSLRQVLYELPPKSLVLLVLAFFDATREPAKRRVPSFAMPQSFSWRHNDAPARTVCHQRISDS
jgi:hypothetical protein